MPIDHILEDFANNMYTFFRSGCIAAIPYILAALNLANDMWGKCVRQLGKSITALRNSFHDEVLVFYFLNSAETTNTWIPVVTNNLIMELDEESYMYSMSRRVFGQYNVNDSDMVHMCHIPFIGASLCRITEDGQERDIYDLSEWIQEQRILSHHPRSMIPLQVLVAAWAYYAQVRVSHGFKDMRLSVMTEDGDEKVFDLATEEEIVQNTAPAALPPSPDARSEGEEEDVDRDLHGNDGDESDSTDAKDD
jgi:hypothetical protein